MILCCKNQPDIFENFLGFDFKCFNNLKKWAGIDFILFQTTLYFGTFRIQFYVVNNNLKK